MRNPCQHHKSNLNKGYCKGDEKHEKGLEQRQCPHCLRWYFHGEFGRGWKAAIKEPVNNILKP